MDFTCQDALPLVPSYLDGELTEVRAGLLRKHLIDCSACRTNAQDGKALARWFPRPERLEFAPPAGFSARVARRAFAGDAGVHTEVASESAPEGGRLLQFVLTLTAAAAAIMLISAIALRDQRLPNAGSLRASNSPPSVEQVVRKLEELNRLEAVTPAVEPGNQAAPAGLKAPPAPARKP